MTRRRRLLVGLIASGALAAGAARCAGQTAPTPIFTGRTRPRLVPARIIVMPPPPAPPARVFRARGPADLLRGPQAAGRVNDFVLENAYVRAVVDDVSGGGGFALSGGQLIDLALRDNPVDEIGQVFNYLGRFPRQLRYRETRAETRPGGVAAVVALGDDPRTPGLEGRTEYALGPADRAVTLTTTLTNRGNAPTEVGLGDAIQWASAEHWAPGVGFALRGETTEDYLAGIGAATTYALVAENSARLAGPNGGNWSNPSQARRTLAPGESVTYRRRLGVARAGDVAGAVLATDYAHGAQWIRARITDAATGAPVLGARLIAAPAGAGAPDATAAAVAPLAMAAAGDDGRAALFVPPGRFTVTVRAAGRALDAASSARLAQPVDVAAGGAAELALALGPPPAIAVRVRELAANAPAGAAPPDAGEYVPARVLVYGVPPTPDPMFGAIGRGDGARNALLVTAGAPAEVALAPGRYRVVATRGPERTLGESTLELSAGERREVTLTLRHAMPTPGYYCGDFHTHQAPSLDSPVSLRDRVRAAAAEGLEVLAGTDHNVATDLSAAARDEGLAGRLLTLGGDEVSTDVALAPSGHWNLYPIAVDPNAPLGGAPPLFELDPAALVARVRQIAPGAVIQVNHPRSGAPTGMFDVVGFDRATARATRGNMTADFDAVEVWNGRFQPQAEQVMLDWLALLRAGARLTATANSDSHAIVVQEVGYPRTCFRAAAPDVAALTPGDVVRAIRETRDVYLTDGPFLAVETPDGQGAIGRTVAAGRNGQVALRVRVVSPRWAAADTLEMVHADGRIERLNVRFQPSGEVVTAQTTVQVPAREGFVLFRARGAARIPVLVDEPPLYPMALSNPVYLR